MALIGIGGYGKMHLEMIRILERENVVKLVAAADPNHEETAPVQARLRAQHVRCYHDYTELLEEEAGLDLISIVAPIPFHDAMVKDALARDLHVYLEKPPVPTIQQLQELIELDAKQRVTVGFQMSELPTVRRLKEWIVTGAMGEVLQITAMAPWARGGNYYQRAKWAGRLVLDGLPVLDGPASNAISHLVQMIMHFSGGEGSACAVPDWVEGEFYRVRPIESYDVAAIAGGFADDSRFAMFLTHCGADLLPFTVRVKCSRGTAWLTQNAAELASDCGLPGLSCDASPASAIGFYRKAFEQIRAGAPPITSLADCLGFSKTVCGGLLSSGGIHTVSRKYVTTSGTSPDIYYHVSDLSRAAEKACRQGLLPSQLGVPWGVPGRRTDAADVREIDVLQYLPVRPAAGAVG